jgi:hypothetical protein
MCFVSWPGNLIQKQTQAFRLQTQAFRLQQAQGTLGTNKMGLALWLEVDELAGAFGHRWASHMFPGGASFPPAFT